MKLKNLSIALCLSTLPLSTIAAGLDRSGQPITAFLQPGNYAEASYHVLDPSVKGQDNNDHAVSDMGESYTFPTAAIKVQATDKISLGLLYDQPYGADAKYAVDGSDFASTALNEGTQVKVRTNNLTALIGYQPNENWNFYAGPAWQTVKADIALRGEAYSLLSGYNIKVDQKDAFGWVAGAAYQIPEIALKASVTYRSEIKHKANATETTLLPSDTGLSFSRASLDAITPQSVNIDLQTGITQNTLAFANMRWVHWDQFVVSPALLGKVGQDLISYGKDQYSISTGVAHKFNDQWAATALVGWDSGAGNPVTILGPTEGYWSVGLGGQYSPAKDYFIQAGMKYFWLGDAEGQTGGIAKGSFDNNHALGYSVKIGYRF